MTTIPYKAIINPIVWNPDNHDIYCDNPQQRIRDLEWDNINPIMNAKRWCDATLGDGLGSKAASSTEGDPYQLVDMFYNNGNGQDFADLATDYFKDLKNVRQTRDKSLAAAIITSKDYSLLQDTIVLGENVERIRTGVTMGLFEKISVPNLSGKWANFAQDLRYETNIPESKSPEPTFGGYSEVTVNVQKHGGAVGITERARKVINGANVFAKLVNQLQQVRQKKENALVVAEVEATASTPITGVDFGLRSGTPPLSSTNPADFWTNVIGTFEAVTSTSPEFNTILSKAFIFSEYSFNDIVRGAGSAGGPPIATQGSINEQVGPVAGLSGVTWARDNAVTSSTKIYVMDASRCIKVFIDGVRAYTVTDPDTETEKYVTKSYLTPKTVDANALYPVTGAAA